MDKHEQPRRGKQFTGRRDQKNRDTDANRNSHAARRDRSRRLNDVRAQEATMGFFH